MTHLYLFGVTLCATLFCACTPSSRYRSKAALINGEKTAKLSADEARRSQKNKNTGILVDSSSDQKKKETAQLQKKEIPFDRDLELQKARANTHTLEKGKALFLQHCLTCHRVEGTQDSIGPFSPQKGEKATFKIITEGRESKGMPPFQNLLGNHDLIALTIYIESIRPIPTPKSK